MKLIIERQCDLHIEHVDGGLQGRQQLGALVVLEVGAAQVDRRLLEVAHQSHQHAGVDVQLGHACDEGGAEAIQPLGALRDA